MLSFEVKIGLIPIRRESGRAFSKKDYKPGMKLGNFNPFTAGQRGEHCVAYIKEHFTNEHVCFADIEGINEENMLFTEADVPAVVERMQQEKVDAIFLINTNFGNEEVAGMVARELNKPVLLWGPQDDSFLEDGTRYTDTQCGLFGMSRMLQRMNVPFTYIKNCFIEDEAFTQGFKEFISVTCMVKNFHNLRIGQVGLRPKPFCSVIVNEGELMQKFGIQIIPINLANFKRVFDNNLENRKEELAALSEDFMKKFEFDEFSKERVDRMSCFILTYQDLFKQYNLDAVSAECWTAMGQLVQCSPCASYSPLADMGYIIGCESDLHAVITQVLLKSAALGEKVPFLGEFTTRHPSNPNAELLWHCGPFAHSLHDADQPCFVDHMRANLRVRNGEFTVSRFDQEDGKYMLVAGEVKSTEGPYTTGTYLWAEFNDLDAWERRLIEGPYIHHMSEIEGNYRNCLKEFCKYVPNLTFDDSVK